MKSMPVSRKASIPSMKTTLQEKLALIPPTPASPATFEGSLHPSQAKTDGAWLISNAPSTERNRSMGVLLFISSDDASALSGRVRVSEFID